MAHVTSPTAPQPDALNRLRELVSQFRTAMFVTRGREPGLHARPMAVAKMEEDGVLWFVTGRDTPKMGELTVHPDALVCLQKDNQFVTIAGRVEVVQDRSKVEELWSESFRVWFEGKDDPKLVLLRLVPNAGEYWDQSGTRGLEYAFRAAKAYATQERIDPRAAEPATHAALKL